MASVTIQIPDNLVVPLSKALARAMQEPEPTTAPTRIDLAQRFMKGKAKDALMDYRAQEAGLASRTDTTDGAVNW